MSDRRYVSTDYVPTGACSACPYRENCHDARQRAVDGSGLGRHTSCTYYMEFERRRRAGAAVRRSPSERLCAWFTGDSDSR